MSYVTREWVALGAIFELKRCSIAREKAVTPGS